MDGKGLSRRQFLALGGGSVAALCAGVAFDRRSSAPVAVDGAGPAGATTSFRRPPFADAFVNGALPDWNVRRGVAILGATPFGIARAANRVLDRSDFLAGHGTVLGLDGALAAGTGPGLIETVDAFLFEPGSTYRLSFGVAGSHQSSDRLPPSTLTARLPGLGASTRVTLQPHDGFRSHTLDVTVDRPTTSTIVFASENAPGQAGLLLESVSLVEHA